MYIYYTKCSSTLYRYTLYSSVFEFSLLLSVGIPDSKHYTVKESPGVRDDTHYTMITDTRGDFFGATDRDLTGLRFELSV